MTREIELAKQQGLNWQALLIEEAQSEIKLIVTDGVMRQFNFRAIDLKVQARIEKLVKELESEQLKIRCRIDLIRFANRIYLMLRPLFTNIDLAVLMAIRKVADRNATPKEIKTAEKHLKYDVPTKVFERAVPLDIYAKDYLKLVEQRLQEIAILEAKPDYDSPVSLRNIAEMQVRQERHEEELARLIGKGVDLVWIVPHANCSKRCEKWQGKLYSISGQYGNIDGIDYQPLSNATDNYETTKRGKVYKNGCISGFNCRHKLREYKQGNKPVEIPASVVNKERKINDTQRYLERGVRNWKDRALLAKAERNTKQYVYCRQKAKEWENRYIEYSMKNEVAYYPSRTKII